MKVIGIDPGLTGALAMFDTAGNVLVTADMPHVTVTVNKKARKRLNEAALAQALRSMVGDELVHVFIERVNAMPRQGVASSFAFGMATGVVRGIVAGMSLPLTEFTPVEWRKLAGVRGRGGDKGQSLTRAAQLFPAVASTFEKAGHHNRAEAALIAYAGSRTLRLLEWGDIA